VSVYKYIYIKLLRNNSSPILVYSKWFPSGVRILYFDGIKEDNVFVSKQKGMVWAYIYVYVFIDLGFYFKFPCINNQLF